MWEGRVPLWASHPGQQAAAVPSTPTACLSQCPLLGADSFITGSRILIWKGNENSCHFMGSNRPLVCRSLRHFRADWQEASRVERVTQETDWELSPAAPVGVSNRGLSPGHPWGPAQPGRPPPAPCLPLPVSARRSCLQRNCWMLSVLAPRRSALLR